MGNKYYSYLIVYVDDVLCIDKEPDKILNMINRDYRLKEPPATPNMYLGADFSQFTITYDNGIEIDSHIKKALQVVKDRMNVDGVRFKVSKKVVDQLFSNQDYTPELDTSELCNKDKKTFHQSLIGRARWLCELGGVNILTKTSLLSAYLANPRTGHLHQALRMFKYLEDHKRL